jgi:hypothetical protein
MDAYATLDRVRDFLIKLKAIGYEDDSIIIELDEALSNYVDDGDVHDWLTGKVSSGTYFGKEN